LNPQVRSWFAGIHVHRSSATDLQGTFLRSRCSHSMGHPLSDPTHAKRTRQHLLSSLSERGAKIGVSSGAKYIPKLPYVFDVDTVVSFHSAMGMGKPRGRGRCWLLVLGQPARGRMPTGGPGRQAAFKLSCNIITAGINERSLCHTDLRAAVRYD
jgi:hypothetical protein